MKIALMEHAFGLPIYSSEGAAGADIYSAETVSLAPRGRALVKTGLRFEVDPGWELQVRSRSGLAAKHGIFVLNSPGTVDSDYRGELIVVLQNTVDATQVLPRGTRIAQLVPMQVRQLNWMVVPEEDLSETERGHGRFGSTGQ